MIKRKYVLKLTRRGATGLFLFMMMGAVWMFVLGVFVGRSSIPVRSHVKDIKTKLASLKREVKKKGVVETNNETFDFKKRLGFYEDLKKNRTDEEKEVTPRSHKAKSKADISKSAQTHTKTKSKRFTIQVASVKDEATADRIVAELKRDGYPAYKMDVTIPELGRWFRVRIGHYSSKDKADSAIKGLKKKSFKPILLQE